MRRPGLILLPVLALAAAACGPVSAAGTPVYIRG
jgi:hypothetical protein